MSAVQACIACMGGHNQGIYQVWPACSRDYSLSLLRYQQMVHIVIYFRCQLKRQRYCILLIIFGRLHYSLGVYLNF